MLATVASVTLWQQTIALTGLPLFVVLLLAVFNVLADLEERLTEPPHFSGSWRARRRAGGAGGPGVSHGIFRRAGGAGAGGLFHLAVSWRRARARDCDFCRRLVAGRPPLVGPKPGRVGSSAGPGLAEPGAEGGRFDGGAGDPAQPCLGGGAGLQPEQTRQQGAVRHGSESQGAHLVGWRHDADGIFSSPAWPTVSGTDRSTGYAGVSRSWRSSCWPASRS